MFITWAFTFPNDNQQISFSPDFFLLLLCFLFQNTGFVLLTVGRTTVKVASMILKHSLCVWLVAIYGRSRNPSLTAMSAKGMMDVKVSFICLIFQPINGSFAGICFGVEGFFIS